MHKYTSKVIKVKNYSYSPLDQIGKGFSSIVYRGSNQETKQQVAIKVIDMTTIRDTAAKEMLNWQIQALTTLKHNNIMKCYDVVKDSRNCHIITEFCNGGDLQGYLKKKRILKESEMVPILKDIINGLVQIGQKGFLHRDLKLANVLMHDKKAKIADFGFAKKFRQSKEKQRYNVGSPLYESPQALQKNIYSVANDIWAVGIMAYEMLHSSTPWQCRTQAQLINKMTKIPVSFKKSTPISQNMKNFIKKCLQVSESKRMTLKQLKQWNFDGQSMERVPKIRQQNKENSIDINAPVLLKKNSVPQTRKRALSEITNQVNNKNTRKSLQKNQYFVKKISEQPNNQHEVDTTNCQQKLTKSRIYWNNNKITKQVLLFRLYFKTWEKLNQSDNQSNTRVKDILGNQAIRFVTMLKKLICSGNPQTNKKYNLKCYEQYINPLKNPSIKKYQEVISQYFNRYTTKIKMQVITSSDPPVQVIKQYLLTHKKSQIIDKDITLVYWLINLMSVSSDISKKSLENILEPERQITKDQINQRIQLMCVA